MFETTRRIALASTLLITLIAGCAGPITQVSLPATQQTFAQPIKRLAPTLPAPSGPRQAVLFSYIMMDDHLSGFAEQFLNAMESTASNKVHNVAFADLQGGDSSFLFSIQPDRDPNTITSPRSFLSPTVKEVTANDPANLSAATNWAFSTYQGPFRAMDVFAHGGGYLGLGTDETQVGKGAPKQIMSVGEFGNSLRTGLKGRKLHLVNMLSCLMGNVEYAYELRDVADVLVASEDSIYATPHSTSAVTAELGRLLAQPNPDARTIGRNLAIYAAAKGKSGDAKAGYLTVAAVDTGRLDEVRRTVNVMSNSLLKAMPTQGAEIVAAYDAVPLLPLDQMGQRDLWNFCNQLQKVSNPAIRESALAVKGSLKKALLHTRDQEGAAANGLSICMPPRAMLGQLQAHPLFQASLQSKFAKATSWDTFIKSVSMSKIAPPAGSTPPPPENR